MLPLSLDLSRLRIALIGNGAMALRRLAWLEEAGAVALRVFAAAPSPELARAAGGGLLRHWPDRAALSEVQLVFIADVPRAKRQSLARAGRAAGAILHVEDAPLLSDVHAPAVLRRGDLIFAISTCGAAPGLAAELKVFLGEVFGPEWKGRLDEIAELRRRAHAAGADNHAVRQTIAARLAAGWLESPPKSAANDSGRIPNRKGGRS
jgi:precorrin-2 dehydrogenase/sirohydrochlorin ferrochelatase